MPRFCFALDLKNEPDLIAEYERIHQRVWPDIARQIRRTGILQMEIYRTGNRMFLIMDTDDNFSLEAKAAADASDPRVQEWEGLMWTYQQAIPWAKPDEKWIQLTKIFDLNSQE